MRQKAGKRKSGPGEHLWDDRGQVISFPTAVLNFCDLIISGVYEEITFTPILNEEFAQSLKYGRMVRNISFFFFLNRTFRQNIQQKHSKNLHIGH